MIRVHATIQAAQPQRLMKRLCRHWGHKFPVESGEQQSTIELSLGICSMICTDILAVELQGEEQQMPALQQVVADHLQRMAGMEELLIDWKPA